MRTLGCDAIFKKWTRCQEIEELTKIYSCIVQYNQHRTTTHKLFQHTIICTSFKIYDDTSLFPANAIPSVSRCWRCFCIVPTHRFIPFLRWMCDVQQRYRPSTQFGCKSHHRFGSIRCSSKGMCRTEEM